MVCGKRHNKSIHGTRVGYVNAVKCNIYQGFKNLEYEPEVLLFRVKLEIYGEVSFVLQWSDKTNDKYHQGAERETW